MSLNFTILKINMRKDLFQTRFTQTSPSRAVHIDITRIRIVSDNMILSEIKFYKN